MTLDSSADKLPIYNETLKSFSRDIVPRFSEVVVSRLNPLVLARIELEHNMFVCGVEPRPRGLKLNGTHFKVLLEMLEEFDSPSSVRLRAQAAAAAGNYEIRATIPILRKIVLDEDDDLQTRLNAILSFVKMVGDEAYDIIEKVLASPNPSLRMVAYRVALQDPESRIAGLALKRLKKEEDRSVYAAVIRRAAVLQERYTTLEAPHAPVPPKRALNGCFQRLFGSRLTRSALSRYRKRG
jgi:hypothetical protein